MKLKKRYLYIIAGLLTLFAGVFVINAAVNKAKAWHFANDILITIGDFEGSLQQAIDEEYILGLPNLTQAYSQLIPNPGHGADVIWVSVDGSETTLQNAISTIGLCGSFSIASYTSVDIPIQSHFASEIEISSGKSLQDAIDEGDFCCVQDCTCASDTCVGDTCIDSNCGEACEGNKTAVDGGWSAWSAWSSCSVPCSGGTQTRTRTCTNPASDCGGADCVGDSLESRACNIQSCTWHITEGSYIPGTCGEAGGSFCPTEGEACSPYGDTMNCKVRDVYVGYPACLLGTADCQD